MKYIVLARRFRPQIFRDVIGQEAIVTTLKNALRFDRVAHAYLFSGARGVGKTTLARIFAKSLNCLDRKTDFEPCNQCASCLEIIRGQSLDCLEIDGASNRGIDEIRSLNETVGYAPTHGRYKITIIDEVHMLTKEAFNALLKTLEEPPEHAKFFFATTEPHKVLPTIVSRCQRFDLKRLSEEEIVRALSSIVKEVGRETEPSALHLLASFSEGSLRDAESLLDQLLCFSEEGTIIKPENVRSLLGLVPEEIFSEFDRAFAEGNLGFAFTLVERLFFEGKQFPHFLEQMITHYRRLTLAKLSGTSCSTYTSTQLFYILDNLVNGFENLQKSPCQRIALEALLLHILRSKNRVPAEVLIRRLSELEQKVIAEHSDQSLIDSTIHHDPSQEKKIFVDQSLEDPLPINSSVSPKDPSPVFLTSATKDPSSLLQTPHNPSHTSVPTQNIQSPPLLKLQEVSFKPKESLNSPPSSPSEVANLAYADRIAPISSAEEAIPPSLKSAPQTFISPRPSTQTAQELTPQSSASPSPATNQSLPPTPGRYETLLQFAAVELEGTIK